MPVNFNGQQKLGVSEREKESEVISSRPRSDGGR